MAVKKIRVYELAKEIGIDNKATLDLCISLGIDVKSHSSSIEDAQADRVRNKAKASGLYQSASATEQLKTTDTKTKKTISTKVTATKVTATKEAQTKQKSATVTADKRSDLKTAQSDTSVSKSGVSKSGVSESKKFATNKGSSSITENLPEGEDKVEAKKGLTKKKSSVATLKQVDSKQLNDEKTLATQKDEEIAVKNKVEKLKATETIGQAKSGDAKADIDENQTSVESFSNDSGNAVCICCI